MGRVVYTMMVSLDGYIEGPDQKLDWVTIDEELHRFINEREREIGAFLFGRRIYEVMTYWETADTNPSSPDHEVEYARIWQNIPKIVFSRTLERVGGNARLVREDIGEEIAKLKGETDKDLAVGGADLASALIRMGEVDEYGMYVQPVVLGGGKRYFPPMDQPLKLRLIEARTFGSGVVYLRYQPASEAP